MEPEPEKQSKEMQQCVRIIEVIKMKTKDNRLDALIDTLKQGEDIPFLLAQMAQRLGDINMSATKHLFGDVTSVIREMQKDELIKKIKTHSVKEMMLSFQDSLLLADKQFDEAAKNKASLRLNPRGSQGYRLSAE